MFYFEEINSYKVLKSDLGVKEGVNYCFTTKTLPSLNKDEWGNVIFPNSQKIISPQQTHSDNIEIVDECLEYPDTDGLIVTQKNIPIALRFADCTPIIFYDTENKIGAISHAGWRGTAQKIGPKTIEKMRLKFDTKSENVIAIIGPAIGLCCYEVSDEVRGKLLETVTDTTNLTNGKNVDLKQINKRLLEEFGVTKIDVCPYCTSCDNDLFYSYRKENGTQERHYAMLML